MEKQASALTLEMEGGARPIEFMAPEDEERVTSLLAQRPSMRVRIDPVEDDTDTEGHVLASKALVSLRILDEEDDTEGHAISIRFPSVGEARDFRNRLMVTGAIVGSVALAGLGAGAALSQAPGVSVPGSGTSGTEVSDSWSRMGVPGTAAAANAAADELTDSWQRAGVAGTGAAANAEADKLTDSWQRTGVAGTGATAVDPDTLTDSWQRAGGAAGAGSGAAVDPDTLTDSWQRAGVTGAGETAVDPDTLTDSWQRGGGTGAGASGESADESQERPGGR